MKTWFAKVRLEDLQRPPQSPDLYPLSDEPAQTSSPNITNTLVAERSQIHTVELQHPKAFPEEWSSLEQQTQGTNLR